MPYTTLAPEEIKARVYEEVKKQFLEKGIKNTDMKQVARDVGIGRTTLYRYYPSRDQLAFMVSLEFTEIFLQSSIGSRIDPTLNGYEKMRMFFDYFIDNILQQPAVLKYFSEFDQMFADDYPDFREAAEYDERMKKNTEAITQYMIQGQADGSIRSDEEPFFFTVMHLNAVLGLAQRIVTRSVHYDMEKEKNVRMLRKVSHRLLSTIKA